MDSKEVKHWDGFNISARIGGFLFLVGGLLSSYLQVKTILNLKASNIDISDVDYETLGASILVVIIGFLAMTLKRYYPQNIKDNM